MKKEKLMNINELTIDQVKELANLFSGGSAKDVSPHIGKKCIIRTYASGVHFGELVSQVGRQVELKKSRRLWYWDVAPNGISLSEVAVYGPIGSRSRICCVVDEIVILDAIEIIPCTDEAVKVIEDAKTFTP